MVTRSLGSSCLCASWATTSQGPRQSPVSIDTAEPRGLSQVVGIQQSNARLDESRPHRVPGLDGPGRRVPVPSQDSLLAGHGNVFAERGELGVVERRPVDGAKVLAELRGRDRAHFARDVGLRRAQQREVGVEKVVSVVDALDEVQRRVSRAYHRHGPGCDAGAVERGQVSCVTERLELFDHDGPCAWTMGLEVDEQVESLP